MGIIPTIDGSDLVVREGLVGRWMGGVGGTPALGTVLDTSPKGNNGTCVGNAFVNQDGLQMDETGDILTVLANLEPKTVCFWWKSTLSGAHRFIGNWPQWLVYAEGSTLNLGISGMGGRILTTILANQWNHICVTRGSTNTLMFVGGTLVGTTSTVSIEGGNIIFGEVSGYDCFLDGAISDARIYNRALSAAEVKAIYNNTKWRHQNA